MAARAEHATFVIERRFPANVQRVFRAWSVADKKKKWLSCHEDWRTTSFELDFRVGGVETSTVERPDGARRRRRASRRDTGSFDPRLPSSIG
jgi:uncharacterized protein YndB with AHSA1/START domain